MYSTPSASRQGTNRSEYSLGWLGAWGQSTKWRDLLGRNEARCVVPTGTLVIDDGGDLFIAQLLGEWWHRRAIGYTVDDFAGKPLHDNTPMLGRIFGENDGTAFEGGNTPPRPSPEAWWQDAQ